jgi:surfactin synthase thioesterase subunit
MFDIAFNKSMNSMVKLIFSANKNTKLKADDKVIRLKKNKLFVIPKPLISPIVRLFLFPYAGGSTATYSHWVNLFNDDLNIELVLVQLPGQGSRMNEPSHQSMASLMSELVAHASYIASRPYILFGHSLGGKIAYELACQLGELGLPSPKYVIASGSGAPHLKNESEPIHNLPRNAFISELEKLNGTPQEILSNSELLDFLIPLLRADFKVAYEYQAQVCSLSCPIMVLGGEDDLDVSLHQLQAWEELSDAKTKLQLIPGDHFFINNNEGLVVEKILSFID